MYISLEVERLEMHTGSKHDTLKKMLYKVLKKIASCQYSLIGTAMMIHCIYSRIEDRKRFFLLFFHLKGYMYTY